MSKKRRAPLDGSIWVRTHPVTYLFDHTDPAHDHAWHQLTFAVKGQLEVAVNGARHFIPADRAVWIPAGVEHAETMHAPVTVRSLYVSTRAGLPIRGLRTIAIDAFFRELIEHVSRIGALDRRKPVQSRLVGVLFDQLRAAEEVTLVLPSPRDARAVKLVELIRKNHVASIEVLASKAGASVRTLERAFLRETGTSLGDWRRRLRLFHAQQLLQSGASVSSVASDVGYASVSAFSHAYSQQFGRSPTGRTR